MTLITGLFIFFIALAAIAASAIVISRNVFHSALWLLVCLLSIAALYVLTLAEFLAVVQILIYAGGILIIILFGVMLTTRISNKPLTVGHSHLLWGSLTAIALFVIITLNLGYLPPEWNPTSPEPLTVIARHIFSHYALPFELAGLLLLIALIGAAVISTQVKSNT